MEIGTMNISAMVGPNVAPLATATEKFGIPYFITGPLHSTQYTSYNVISVFSNPMDVVYVAVELAQKYRWDKTAVLYDSQEGMSSGCDNQWLFLAPTFCCFNISEYSSDLTGRYICAYLLPKLEKYLTFILTFYSRQKHLHAFTFIYDFYCCG